MGVATSHSCDRSPFFELQAPLPGTGGNPYLDVFAHHDPHLHGAIRAVLEQGVANRGVSFRNYRDVAGNAGNNQHYVSVFRRTGQPCDMCGTAIERVKLGGRSTHFCPRCQR